MFEIPKEEVKRMKPEDFIETYTYHSRWGWIQHNTGVEVVYEFQVCTGVSTHETWFWLHAHRGFNYIRHYRTLEDLVQGCENEVLLNVFLKENY